MRKILPVLLLFLALCLPSFSASVHVPDITVEQAKSIVINYMTSCGWSLKSESAHSVDFYQVRQAHDESKYHQDELVYERLKEIKNKDESIQEYNRKHPAMAAFNDTMNKPEYWNSTETRTLQFVFVDGNGVTIQTNTFSPEINDMIKIVFSGYYSYEIEYKIPLIKKNYILISDTPTTLYEGQARLGNKRRISKINDKDISNYSKAALRHLLDNCPQDKIKLETNDNFGIQTYYIYRNFNEPTYKNFLQ